MYSLNCKYFKLKFESIEELINYVITSGMDPNYQITKDGKKTNDFLIDLINF
jgi:hypothetical protein